MSTDIYSVELQWHHSALERDFRSTLSLSFMNDFGIQHSVPLRLGLLRANEQVQVGRSRAAGSGTQGRSGVNRRTCDLTLKSCSGSSVG